MKIAYLGIPGSFSHLAAREYFGSDIDCKGQKRFRDVFTAVENGSVDFGIVPVENTVAGSVYDNYDLLYEHPVTVTGEHYLHIELNLIGTRSSMPKSDRIKNISKVVSHYKALEQCDTYISNHPWMQKEIHGDTATAAKFVADQKDSFLAAIASTETAQIYDLEVIQENIHDNPNNYTRFLAISTRDTAIPEDANKCSLIFTLPHTPGSLYAALQSLASEGVNMDKIESRPMIGKPFEYIFYVDFDWENKTVSQMQEFLEEFRTKTNTLKILGLYKLGTNPRKAM